MTRTATNLISVRNSILTDVLSHAYESWDCSSTDWDGWLRGTDRAPVGRTSDPPSKPSDRWYGRDWPRVRSILDLDIYRSASRMVCAENAYASGALQSLIDAVCGSGGKFKSEDKAVERYLQDWSLCYWAGGGDPWGSAPLKESNERQCLRRIYRDGEAFLHVTSEEAKFIDPERVRDYSSGLDGWSYGIRCQTEPYDVTYPEEYSFIGTQGQQAIVPAEEVIHVPCDGTDSTVKRGLPVFKYGVLQGFLNAANVLEAIAIGTRIRSSIALLWSIPWGDSDDVSGITHGKATSSPSQGRNPDSQYPPGTEVFAPTDHIPQPLPADYTPQQLEAVQASLRMCGSALVMPEYMISGSSDNANYASTREAGTPFVRRAQGLQQRLRSVALRLGRYALQHAERIGTFTTQEIQSARFDYELPDVVVTETDRMAASMVSLVEKGVLTQAEARVALGYPAKPHLVN